MMSQATHSPEEDLNRKQLFWDSLSEQMPNSRIPFTILLGDFNTRLTTGPTHNILIQDLIGPYLFGKDVDYTQAQTTPNSEFMHNFLEENYVSIPSTFLKMHPSKRITFRNIQSSEFANTLNPSQEDFAVLDYFITPVEGAQCFKSIYSDTQCALPSRRFPIMANLEVD